jgi:NADH-quinone oxidoreductase subunit D
MLDGEKVQRVDVHCGYLHRGFEKECEDHTWHNLIPYVDRLNYCSGSSTTSRTARRSRR